MRKRVMAAVLGLGLLAGCGGLKAVAVDSSSLQTALGKIRLANGGHQVLVLEGESERWIPLKRINWIKISAREMRNRNGRTFYLTEIELRDGSKLMSYRLKDGRRSQVFIWVEDSIMAQTPNGPVQLELSKVSKLTFEHSSRSGKAEMIGRDSRINWI